MTNQFAGRERAAETANSAMATGLDYFGARYFSGAQGRFTGPDEPLEDQYPEDPQSWNLYSYVRNNPLKFTDPTGQDCFYTSNQTDQSVTVSVETGSCSQKGGTYVNGTIDMNSLAYNGKSLDVGYQDYNGAATVLSKNFGPAVYEFPGVEGPANQAGAAHIAGSQALINEFAKQAAFQALGGVAGRLIGAGIDAGLAARAAAAQAEAVQFGKTANQVYHVFRHLQEAGVNIETAKDAILSDISSKGALSPGLTTGTVNVGGRSLTYNAFKLADGTINVGRITVK